jgi:hypothetical protein
MEVWMDVVDPAADVPPHGAAEVAGAAGSMVPLSDMPLSDTPPSDVALSDLHVDALAGPDVAELLSALEAADDLPLDDRLELLRTAEASIAGVLEGLDGL